MVVIRDLVCIYQCLFCVSFFDTFTFNFRSWVENNTEFYNLSSSLIV